MIELRIVLFAVVLLVGFGALVQHADSCARRADFPAKASTKENRIPAPFKTGKLVR